MGTFIGHLVPGLALACLGLWHTINTILAYYLKGSTKFTIKFWHPFRSPILKLEHLELLFVLSFSLSAIVLQIFDFQHLHFFFKLDGIEHATMFLQLTIFAGFTLFTELNHLSESMSSVSGILVSSVFGTELFLLHYHSTDHVGLEGHYHWLMQLIVCVSFLAAILSTSFPSSFQAALILATSVVFQGCWFINMGFVLWVPKFVPRGCIQQPMVNHSSHNDMHGAVVCATHEADSRAMALANLQFCWIFSVILIFMTCTCVVFGRRCSLRRDSLEYERLTSQGARDPIESGVCKQIQL